MASMGRSPRPSGAWVPGRAPTMCPCAPPGPTPTPTSAPSRSEHGPAAASSSPSRPSAGAELVLDRRTLRRADVEVYARRHRNWGQWGPDDELGSANYLTAERVAAAAQEIRRGTVFSLALPMDNNGPMKGVNGRVNPQHVMLRTGGDVLATPGETGDIRVTDDAVYMPLQASTQWDALCHIMFQGHAYNGRGYDSVTSAGARFNSITNLRDRCVGRGVLLDLPRWLGRPWLEPGDVVQAEDLDACARHQGVEVAEGDFLLVRTGHLAQCRAEGDWGTYCGGSVARIGRRQCGLPVPSTHRRCRHGHLGHRSHPLRDLGHAGAAARRVARQCRRLHR